MNSGGIRAVDGYARGSATAQPRSCAARKVLRASEVVECQCWTMSADELDRRFAVPQVQ